METTTKEGSREYPFEMEATLLDKWMTALESDDYAQGDGKLYDSDHKSYCCLGVAGKVFGLEETFMDDCAMFTEIGTGMSEEEMGEWKEQFQKLDDLPQILFEEGGGHKTLVDMLVSFNDGTNGSVMKQIKDIPGIIVPDTWKDEYTSLSFKEIAQFLRNNVKPI